MKHRILFALCLAGLLASPGLAQQLSVVVQMSPAPSPYLSDWRSKSNTVMLVVSNPTGTEQDVRIDAYVEGDRRGRVAETKLNAGIPPVTIPRGVTTLNAVSGGLLSEEAVRYVGPSASEAMRSGRLPEDNYRLCVRLVRYDNPDVALSQQACSRFEIRLIQPPDLIAPQNKAEAAASPVFQWSAVPMGTGTFAEYEITVIQVDAGMKNLTDAIESAPALVKREVRIPVYQYLPSDPPLENGKTYAWRVRAFDPLDRYTFVHDGKSVVWTFTAKTMVAARPTGTAGTKTVVKAKQTEALDMGQVYQAVLKNSTINGTYYYAFEKNALVHERRCGEKQMQYASPDYDRLKPLKHCIVRLVRMRKVLPAPSGGYSTATDVATGKVIDVKPKIIATAMTDNDGKFLFTFINGDSSLMLANRMIDVQTEFNSAYMASLYQYYVVEVLNARFCSSGSELRVEPGETENVLLTSFVRTYNLDVFVRDAEKYNGVTLQCMVYLSRNSDLYLPSMPKEEGELAEPVTQQGPMGQTPYTVTNPNYPTRKFTSAQRGYIISAHPTEYSTQSRRGHVVFTRLVRNTGSWDLYQISARTPQIKDDGNPNDLYYFDGDKIGQVQKPSKYGEDEYDPGDDYSGPVVNNLSYEIPTFQTTVDLVPRMPRIYGQVNRSDSKTELSWACLTLEKVDQQQKVTWAKTIFTDEQGRYEFANIDPSPGGPEWRYSIVYQKYGYRKYVLNGLTATKGIQQERNQELSPSSLIVRHVVDEWAQPLPGVKALLGGGLEQTSNSNGGLVMLAAAGSQLLHLERRTEYADKDSNVVVQEDTLDFSVNDASKWIVMFKAQRRLCVKVVGPGPDYTPIQGAEVILLDKYTGDPAPPPGVTPDDHPAPVKGQVSWKRHTGADGRVSFMYESPDSVAHISVRVPDQPYVPQEKTISNVPQNGHWKISPVFLAAGGIVQGTVYAGERNKFMRRVPGRGMPIVADSVSNPPVANARVFVESFPGLETRTDADGKYKLIGVPVGSRTIKACKMADSVGGQFIGESHTLTIAALDTRTVNFYLRQYFDMDITKLYGIPIEVESLQELSGGRIRIDGAFVKFPSNSVFRMRNSEDRQEFHAVDLTPAPGTGTPPAAQASNGAPIPLLPESVPLLAHGKFMVDVVDNTTPAVAPMPGDMKRGSLQGRARIDISCFNINSNQLDLHDSTGAWQELYLGILPAQPASSLQMHIGALTSDGGTFESGGNPLRIAREDGKSTTYRLLGYVAAISARESWLASDGMHLATVIRAVIPSCGSSMSGSCDIELPIGVQLVTLDGLAPLDQSQLQVQDITLQQWKLHIASIAFHDDYFHFDGAFRVPLVQNLTGDSDRISVPFTGMELRPDGLSGGTFSTTQVDLMGIATLRLTKPVGLYKDWKSWIIASDDPYISALMYGSTYMQGLSHDAKIELETFYLRSDATTDFTPAQKELLAWDVSTFQPNTFQFGFQKEPYLSMVGTMTLINVPDIGPQATRFIYTKGGQFNMDGVYLATPFNAGGVQVTIANGMLGPDGFKAEGDWGDYHNRIILEGSFTLNMWFLHRKIGTNKYSTFAEIINPDHQPPQNQSMFRNPSGPDVWSSYGRTQMEPDMSWSTNLAGWYRTGELAGKDSMYYVVVGTGGHGSVNTANGTLKMKGTSGGLSSLYYDKLEYFPKGPAMGPPPEDDGPFSNFEITMDFEKLAIIASCSINAGINGGVSFEGGITTVISFGEKKFWSFIAYGTGKVDNPPCSGSAVFLAGVNYEVSADDQQIVIDYSISKRPIPQEFMLLSGFFTQVAVTLPIPGTPNFDIDLGFAGLAIECSMGGEARVGLNFAGGGTFFIGLYFTAQVKVDAFVILSAWVLGFEAEAHLLVKVELGAWFTYNGDAGAAFDFLGSIIGKLDFGGCVIVMGEEVACGDFTLFAIGGEVKGRVGNNEYLDVTPTFTFLGMNF